MLRVVTTSKLHHQYLAFHHPQQVQVGSTPQDQRIVGYISCTHLHALPGRVWRPMLSRGWESAPPHSTPHRRLGLMPGPGWGLTAALPSGLYGSAPQRTVPSGVSSWTCFRTGWLISENLPPRPAQPTPRSWWRLMSSAEILTLTTAPLVRWWSSPIGWATGAGGAWAPVTLGRIGFHSLKNLLLLVSTCVGY